MGKEATVNLETLKLAGVDVEGAVAELQEVVKRMAAGHKTSIGGNIGQAPELTDGQVRAVVRKYFTTADVEGVFEHTVAAVKARLGNPK